MNDFIGMFEFQLFQKNKSDDYLSGHLITNIFTYTWHSSNPFDLTNYGREQHHYDNTALCEVKKVTTVSCVSEDVGKQVAT